MNNARIIPTVAELTNLRRGLEGTVGFVPTMGALHPGHVSLIQRSARENDHTILSIFVNPTQFNDPRDLEKYPRTLEADSDMAESAGADIVFLPNANEVYPDSYRYQLSEKEFSKILCGAHRPGHFDGVLTVVMKLLNIVRPDNAYFGEKDYQQLRLIEDMVQAFFLQCRIVRNPTVREASGLAMSSRNQRLSPAGRVKAAEIYRVLTKAPSVAAAQIDLTRKGFVVDYLEEVQGRRFVAAFLEGVRLIDNVAV